MMLKVEQPVALICSFTWVGFVCAISFLEAWLKFKAPGVTMPVGLSTGRLVFNTLNKIEWVFAIVILISCLWYRTPLNSLPFYLLLIILAILIFQTFRLLPQLDARASVVIQGGDVPPSSLHILYVACELVKTISLVAYGISLLKEV